MTEYRTIKEIGEITFFPTKKEHPALVAYSKIGAVFCDNKQEAIEKTIRWDFVKRATPAEVHALHKK